MSGNTTLKTNHTTARGVSTRTEACDTTTELIAYVVVALGVLIVSSVTDASDFTTQEAWFYVSLLTIGYMMRRGLPKSGSRNFYGDQPHANQRYNR